jgi:hypothetical protein
VNPMVSEQKSVEYHNEQGGLVNVKIDSNNLNVEAKECVVKKSSSETSPGECRRKYAKRIQWERATYCSSTYFYPPGTSSSTVA